MSQSGDQTMKAAVFTGPGQMKLKDVPVPIPQLDEVLIRIQGCGVCASNLAHWEGMPWSQFPMAPGSMGHEAWGVVEAIGSQVKNFSVGERVTGLSYHSYAEYDISKSDALLKLPESMNHLDFPGESLGCAFNIFRRSQIQSGQTVAIVGIGFLGAILTRLASLAGARVIAISRRPFSLEIAKTMGANDAIVMDDHSRIIESVKKLTDEELCHCVIEATGKQWPLTLSAEITGERGRLVIAGYHQEGPRQVNMQLWNWRGLDVVNAHERQPQIYLEGIRAAINAVSEGLLDPTSLLTHSYPLERLNEALNATRDRPEGFMKAIMVHKSGE